MKKRILAALLAASMALCAGCGSQTSDDGEEQTAAGTAVEVAEVTKGAMSTEYSVNGKVVADNEVQVFPMLAGQVLTLSVSEGDKVAKGQTLLNVDTSSVTSTMSSLRESYNATKTATEKAIENAQIGVEQAQLAVENTEALLEGVVIFLIMFAFSRKANPPRPRGTFLGLFLVLYGCFRILIEFVRLPDVQIGYFFGTWGTMGQLLSLPMVVAGICILVWATKKKLPQQGIPLPKQDNEHDCEQDSDSNPTAS